MISSCFISQFLHLILCLLHYSSILEENPPSADSSQTMQCEIDDFTSTIQGLDNELKQTEKKRNLLLKKHHLVSVQRKIQVLQS